jgi:hypothetical protein
MHPNLLMLDSPLFQCLLPMFRGEAPGGQRVSLNWIWKMLPVRVGDLTPVSVCIRRARRIYLPGISGLLELLAC